MSTALTPSRRPGRRPEQDRRTRGKTGLTAPTTRKRSPGRPIGCRDAYNRAPGLQMDQGLPRQHGGGWRGKICLYRRGRRGRIREPA